MTSICELLGVERPRGFAMTHYPIDLQSRFTSKRSK